HQEWLDLVEVSGPFLTMPVLRRAWPQLDALDKEQRTRLRARHADWQADPAAARDDWAAYVLRDLLEWRDALALRRGEDDDLLLDRFTVDVPEHDTRLRADFALVEPGTDPAAEPDTAAAAKHIRVLGMLLPAGTAPTARDDRHATWSATPADRLARLLRHHDVPLGIVTDGRWWCLVWAPVGGVTTTAVFDAAGWNEASERTVVRAWTSLLRRSRFFEHEDADTLLGLLKKSLEAGEEVTDALGVQVRQAVELLVDAIGRADARAVEHGAEGLHARGVPASEVYRGAVAVMMRIVFLLFAEERGLLPADNEVYATSYSAGRLCAELEARAQADGEGSLEHTTAAWHRLIALFHAVHAGVDHPELHLPAYDGSIFDPQRYAWLESTSPLLPVDDRTVLHMLQAVQYVQIGTGKNRERRRLTFRALDVEQIGYVYEGLLSYDGRRAVDTVVGLIGPVGKEHEVPLRDLEAIAAASKDVKTLAKKVSDAYKEPKPGIGTPAKLEKLLAPLAGEEKEEARRLLLAASRDRELAERLLPFFGILRRDLRDLPVVIRAGALYVTESALRKNTGTHYTPRFLAEEVVHHALEPLVYEPGPLQTADTEQWRLKSPDDILALKVADIAMGSAAFLVAACRYLGDRLIEAWEKEGREAAVRYRTGRAVDAVTAVDAEQDPVVIEARRQVIEHCLYGVDINPMAVEMAKLSLWLVSMDPTRPFTFLDDRLVAGDSLLGVTSMEQIEVLHLDPSKGREDIFGWIEGARGRVQGVAAERAAITAIEGRDIAALEQKRQRLRAAEQHTERLRLIGDLISGAALATCASGRVPWYEPESGERMRNLFPKAEQIAGRIGPEDVPDDSDEVREARALADEWLASELPDDALDRKPVHWPLVFPEVFLDRGGFDAIVGNPPFLGGQKLTGAMGDAYREYMVDYLADGKRGSADLVAYFELRVHRLLNSIGQTGLIATNTLAQGDTREVGLDQLGAAGIKIRRAIKSAPWPSRSAVLEYCAVWTSRAFLREGSERILDGLAVPYGINTGLNPETRESSWAEPLEENDGVAFIGSYVLGMGFVLPEAEARSWIEEDKRYSDVLFPYVTGEDLNQSPAQSTRRWVIDFHTWPLDRANLYERAMEKVVRDVKPERAKNKDKNRREIWWRFTRPAVEMRASIANLDQCIALAQVSKTVVPVMVSTGPVFSHKVVIFPFGDYASLAFFSSCAHYWWAVERSATMKADLSYSPSDVTVTLVRPRLTADLRDAGTFLDSFRRGLMLSRNVGLTTVYNLVHDPACEDDDIVELRRIHEEIDRATVAAYGWHDLLDPTGATPPADPTHETFPLDHGFHETDQGTRYTIGLLARTEIIDRLRQLNHQAYADEVFLGLHKKPKKHPDMPPPSPEAVRRKAEGKGGSTGAGQSPEGSFSDDGLFPPEDALF
ncbi:Eco57I restriction-modification methylase domain-containing protein, partial [Streptomyces sp. NPDC059506]|uniref:Eco57I restriction-modification methylase domain-containing protein n=1 Tax=Streptomyces sp. NPDC059506 TaxID=3347751 RepID=UPI0036AC7547